MRLKELGRILGVLIPFLRIRHQQIKLFYLHDQVNNLISPRKQAQLAGHGKPMMDEEMNGSSELLMCACVQTPHPAYLLNMPSNVLCVYMENGEFKSEL